MAQVTQQTVMAIPGGLRSFATKVSPGPVTVRFAVEGTETAAHAIEGSATASFALEGSETSQHVLEGS